MHIKCNESIFCIYFQLYSHCIVYKFVEIIKSHYSCVLWLHWHVCCNAVLNIFHERAVKLIIGFSYSLSLYLYWRFASRVSHSTNNSQDPGKLNPVLKWAPIDSLYSTLNSICGKHFEEWMRNKAEKTLQYVDEKNAIFETAAGNWRRRGMSEWALTTHLKKTIEGTEN